MGYNMANNCAYRSSSNGIVATIVSGVSSILVENHWMSSLDNPDNAVVYNFLTIRLLTIDLFLFLFAK